MQSMGSEAGEIRDQIVEGLPCVQLRNLSFILMTTGRH